MVSCALETAPPHNIKLRQTNAIIQEEQMHFGHKYVEPTELTSLSPGLYMAYCCPELRFRVVPLKASVFRAGSETSRPVHTTAFPGKKVFSKIEY